MTSLCISRFWLLPHEEAQTIPEYALLLALLALAVVAATLLLGSGISEVFRLIGEALTRT